MAEASPTWRSQFMAGVEWRNRLETVAFASVYEGYSTTKQQLDGMIRFQNQWTQLTFTGRDPEFSRDEGLGSLDVYETNKLLRDQILLYEKNLQALDERVKAAHTCMVELEAEVRRFEADNKDLRNQLRGCLSELARVKRPSEGFDRSGPSLDASGSHQALDSFVTLEEPRKRSPLSFGHALRRLTNATRASFTRDKTDVGEKPIATSKLSTPHQAVPTDSHMKQPRLQLSIRAHNGAVTCMTLCATPDQNYLLVTGGSDGFIAVSKLEPFQICFSLRVCSSMVTFVGLSPDQKLALAAFSDRALAIVDIQQQAVVQRLGPAQGPISGCGFIDVKKLTPDHRDRDCDVRSTGFIALQPSSVTAWLFSSATDKCLYVHALPSGHTTKSIKTSSPITACSQVVNDTLVLGHLNGCLTVGVFKFVCFDVCTAINFEVTGMIRPLTPLLTSLNDAAIHSDAIHAITLSPSRSNDDMIGISLGLDRRLIEFSIAKVSVKRLFLVPSDFKLATPLKIIPVLSPSQDWIAVPDNHTIFLWNRFSRTVGGSWSAPVATTALIFRDQGVISGHADGSLLSWKFEGSSKG